MAVMMMTRHLYSTSVAWLLAVTIGALAIPLLLSAASAHPRIARIIAMVGVALVLSAGLSYAVDCCGNCDPWWLTYFWVCVPPSD